MLCLRDWVQEERRRKKAEEEARKKEARERKKREAEERLSKKGPNFIITKRSDAEKAGVSIAGFVFFSHWFSFRVSDVRSFALDDVSSGKVCLLVPWCKCLKSIMGVALKCRLFETRFSD